MEFVTKYDGLGEFELTEQEVFLMLGLNRLATENKVRYHLGQPGLPESQQFASHLSDLFPDLPKNHSNNQAFTRATDRYEAIIGRNATEVVIPTIIPLDTIGGYGKQAELQIFFPPTRTLKALGTKFCMTLHISAPYQELYSPCIDGVAKILGEREKPELEGLEVLPDNAGHDNYGIAQVHRLADAFRIYQRATRLVGDIERLTGVKLRELDRLRCDGNIHENLAIRDLSRDRYQAELQRLVTH